MRRWQPLLQLFLARMREFYREPEVIFWVYGFPLLLALGLSMAFTSREPEVPVVDVVGTPADTEAEQLRGLLAADGIKTEVLPEGECHQRYRTGKSNLYVAILNGGYRYTYDTARPESVLARCRVDAVVERLRAHIERPPPAPAADSDPDAPRITEWKSGNASWRVEDAFMRDPGNRYIDFLIPGLMGLNLMGGGLWGVGFVIVDMRVRKLLKRLLATPMRRTDFLLSVIGARMVFMVPEMALLVIVGHYGFRIPVLGSLLALAVVLFAGSFAFSGLGLLVASRTGKTETVTGLMNMVMLPMWLLSGTFFSSRRFPEVTQPVIQALPLTQVNDALREILLEGAGLFDVRWHVAVLAAWAGVTFLLALKWFRWQ